MLKPRLDSIIRQIDKRDWFGNPVTDFYQSPVAEIPTAVGLSKNYSKNFLGQLIPDVFLRNQNSDDFMLDVWVQLPGQSKDDLCKLTHEERSHLKFEILIPAKMSMTDHEFIDGLKQPGGGFQYLLAKITRRTRDFYLHYRLSEDNHYILADPPTVLSTLNESIRRRRRIHADLVDNEEWQILEGQELERFATKCEQFKDRILEKYPFLSRRIEVVWRWNPLGVE